ncbi:MAG TPA: DinB family protein [Gemmatimonadaceae bacterium]|jgi:uncharacterized damage-inducible protein DinB|nr:DinB family protein [Gemmatimonadaceae bacterium]
MNVAEVIDLYEYNRWAHERTLEAAAELSREQYERAVVSSFPSVRATLEHVLATEVVWLSRWAGHSLGDAPDYSGITDVPGLARLWRLFWHRQFTFLNALSDDELASPIAIRTRSGIETVQPLVETLIHVVNHATYHRGQVVTLLRHVGGTPRATDYFNFCLGKVDESE